VEDKGVTGPGVPTGTIVLGGGVEGAEETKVFNWNDVGDCGGVGTLMVVPPDIEAGDDGRDPGADDMEEAYDA
jgi:hypothetical protein